jgi:hypothetical protein
MIKFVLNKSVNLLEIWDDKKEKKIDSFCFVHPHESCVVYLKKHVYSSVKGMIEQRKFAYTSQGIIDVKKASACDYYLEKLNVAYQSNFYEQVLSFLKFEMCEIFPHASSKFFDSFCRKRDDLIETIEYYVINGNPMYYINNNSVQLTLKL